MNTEYYFKGIRKLMEIEKETLLRIEKQLADCRKYAGQSLKVYLRRGVLQRYAIENSGGRRSSVYLKDCDEDNVRFKGIVNYRFFKVFERIVRSNIEALGHAIDSYQEYTLESLMGVLPKTYRVVTPEIASFFPAVSGDEWKRRMMELKKLNPPPHPEHLRYITADGTRVRSKSEVIIYNMLLRYGYVFVYEAPYVLEDGSIWHPDFTILKPDGQGVLYIEHNGSYGDKMKREYVHKKMSGYYDNGLSFYRDILYTFDDADGSIDSEMLEKMVLDCLCE